MPLVAAAGTGVVLLVALFVGILAALTGTGAGAGGAGGGTCQGTPGAGAAGIPPAYLALYVRAGVRYGIPWNVLAAVGSVESDHGRGRSPGITSGSNYAGASGPMQFLAGTWAAFGVDGDHNGTKNVFDPADAIPGAANYLRHNGAPAKMRAALFAYNHSTAYVNTVLARATTYARGTNSTSACADPAGLAGPVSGRAGTVVRAALRWIGTPYSWGGGGLTGPTRGFGRGAGTVGFDCSGLTRYAWHQAGVNLPRTSQEQWRTLPHVPAAQASPGDLVFFKGSYGTMNAPGHVALVIDGRRMVEAPYTGAAVRISPLKGRSDLVGYARPRTTR
ncbi:C40 family peptidase [Actinomadura parmotrematis]|uniref:C40 family peptidase n=1 Tax=Actinomadura parmotrematis TaxID=2864039 RepID=A0ABS7G3K1_9ACTN|nr:NlpC/P60 family protein [Actinomadura parmotrematis]MBW8487294.1 C40 family peptidase [Actinomadura parmotrematis]